MEVFTWSAYDTPGLNPEIACYKLNINPFARPVVQKSRRSSIEHIEAVIAEVEKLLASGAIREVYFPPPRVDQLVDSTAGHEHMSFLDAYSGYQKIPLFGPDQEKTSFITLRGTYCYKVMSFSLKNVRATYQRMITRMFKDQLGKIMEAYIDDMVVKSKLAINHLADLREVFDILKNHQLRLNASKCAVGVGTGKFLGYMATHRGIEANPDQIKVIQELKVPTKAKELQKLAGMATALNRFIRVVLMSPKEFIWEQALRLGWKASNNEAKYEALLAGLRSAEHFSAEQLLIFSDSQLVVNQLSGVYEARDKRMVMSLVHRALTYGYWWPRMQQDAQQYVRRCDKCQRFVPLIHQPAKTLTSLTNSWPFVQWGLDIVGPLARGTGNRQFFIATIDYFTKWVKVEALASIKEGDTKRFVMRNVVVRFGISRVLIADNGTQFDEKILRKFCADLRIEYRNSSPGYPQSNGQAEASNKTIINGVKKRLKHAKGK
ncbi:uncharacterized protein LOC114289895 [Camellia sinensis]|uniref:uncharacterized protein LOC114289895 n=1 Tax=Camellia sinensis TaxID=4442 RepID=UPI001036EA50|nr:uncharacterized protein LOC114289895 [Camellia sinensis]